MIEVLVGVFGLLFLGTAHAAAQQSPPDGQEPWSIETANPDGTPTIQFEHEATEGTWMSVDVSPDGKKVAFDLLGHIFEMPISGGTAIALTEVGQAARYHREPSVTKP